jgi:predicted carbohydrate-binding protein with CBM5 and CBM33 domain
MLTAATLLAIAGLVSAHGEITSPPPRRGGPALVATCGQQAANNLGNAQGNVQGMLQTARGQPDFDAAACNAFLCKGFKYEDNIANVQSFTAGQNLDMRITIGAPHTGVANVSVVDTASNTIIGQPLISFTDYASNQRGVAPNNTAFTVTLPDVSSQCSTPGACVLQWFWDATGIDQTYEDCVDFTMGGGGGAAPAPVRPSSTVAAAIPASSAAAPVVSTRAAVTVPSPSAGPDDLECDDDEVTPTVSARATASATATATATPGPDDLECDDDEVQGVIGRRHARDFAGEY